MSFPFRTITIPFGLPLIVPPFWKLTLRPVPPHPGDLRPPATSSTKRNGNRAALDAPIVSQWEGLNPCNFSWTLAKRTGTMLPRGDGWLWTVQVSLHALFHWKVTLARRGSATTHCSAMQVAVKESIRPGRIVHQIGGTQVHMTVYMTAVSHSGVTIKRGEGLERPFSAVGVHLGANLVAQLGTRRRKPDVGSLVEG